MYLVNRGRTVWYNISSNGISKWEKNTLRVRPKVVFICETNNTIVNRDKTAVESLLALLNIVDGLLDALEVLSNILDVLAKFPNDADYFLMLVVYLYVPDPGDLSTEDIICSTDPLVVWRGVVLLHSHSIDVCYNDLGRKYVG